MQSYVPDCGIYTLTFLLVAIHFRIECAAVSAQAIRRNFKFDRKSIPTYREMVFHPKHWLRWTSRQWLKCCQE